MKAQIPNPKSQTPNPKLHRYVVNLVAILAVVQTGRLSAFIADSSRLWGSTVPDPVAARHQCLSAYVYAADLSRAGERNIYDSRLYPAFTQPPGRSTGMDSPGGTLGG